MLKKVLKNTSWLLSSHVLSYSVGLGILLLISRTYGVVGYGIYVFIESFAPVLAHLCNLGQLEYCIRQASRNKRKINRYLPTLLVVKVIIWGALYLGMLLIVFLVTEDPLYRAGFIIIGFRGLFSILATQFRVVFWAYEQMKYHAYLLSFRAILTLLLMIGFVVGGFGLEAIFFSSAFAAFLTFIVGFFLVMDMFKLGSLRFDSNTAREIFRASKPFFITKTMNKIRFRVPGWLLFASFGPGALGVFFIVFFPVAKLGELVYLFGTSLYPSLSKLKSIKRKMTEFFVGFRFVLSFGVVSSLTVIVLSPFIAGFLYESVPSKAWVLVTIMGVSLLFTSVNHIASVFFFSTDRQWLDARISFTTLLIMAICGFLLVPILGYFGAALAFLFTVMSSTLLKYGAILTIKHKYG